MEPRTALLQACFLSEPSLAFPLDPVLGFSILLPKCTFLSLPEPLTAIT
jgi:hypothetical protein